MVVLKNTSSQVGGQFLRVQGTNHDCNCNIQSPHRHWISSHPMKILNKVQCCFSCFKKILKLQNILPSVGSFECSLDTRFVKCWIDNFSSGSPMRTRASGPQVNKHHPSFLFGAAKKNPKNGQKRHHTLLQARLQWCTFAAPSRSMIPAAWAKRIWNRGRTGPGSGFIMDNVATEDPTLKSSEVNHHKRRVNGRSSVTCSLLQSGPCKPQSNQGPERKRK